jgi:integrase/recombinase XerD
MARQGKVTGKGKPSTRPAGKRRGRVLPRFLTPEEAEKLLAQVNPKSVTGLRNQAALLLMLRAGLRVSEVAQLHLSDLDLRERRLTVRRGKGAKDRTLYLDQQTAEALGKWLALEKRPKSQWLLPTVQTGRRGVGVSQAGAQIGRRYLQAMVARLGREAGLPKEKCHPHALRHTFATSEIARGVPVHQLQADLGHADLATTSVYLHVMDAQRQETANGRPPMRLPGQKAAPAGEEAAGDTGEEASAILAALGWRRQSDGSWLPPGRGR